MHRVHLRTYKNLIKMLHNVRLRNKLIKLRICFWKCLNKIEEFRKGVKKIKQDASKEREDCQMLKIKGDNDIFQSSEESSPYHISFELM